MFSLTDLFCNAKQYMLSFYFYTIKSITIANHRGWIEVSMCFIKSGISADPTVPFNQTPCKLLRVPSDFTSEFPKERASAC